MEWTDGHLKKEKEKRKQIQQRCMVTKKKREQQ